jgi:hypothetical protein
MTYAEFKQILGVKSISFSRFKKADGSDTTHIGTTPTGISVFVTNKTDVKAITNETPVAFRDNKWFVGVTEGFDTVEI